jgi:TolA-binding protein
LEFGDGSSVLPDAHTRVVPELVAADKIQVRQSGGSATYEVTPHPHRSFVVRVKEVRVEVIGTAFRIDDLEAAVRVTVQRGRVRVTRGARTVILGAGESLLLRDRDDEVAVHAASSGASPLASDSIPLLDLTDAAATEPTETSAAELFRSADDARAAGNSVEALRLLKLLVQQHPLDRRVTLARFTMGRIEAQRDNFAEAARAFESCGNALSGEALAEAALARAAAGQASEAKAHAKHYREQFPGGPRYRELAKLAE